MTREGNLFVVSGSSGVGKGTINKAVLERVKDIRMSVSATTRPKRAGEVEGKDYFFITPEEFSARVRADEFLECARVYSHMYGTPKRFVLDNLQQGFDLLLEIDIQGAMKVKEQLPRGVFIFIQPPSMEALAQRIYGRGKDSPDSIEARLAAYDQEIAMIRHYDYVVVNDELEDAVHKVQAIIIAERCRVKI